MSDSQMPARDTTFDNIVPEKIWVTFDNQVHGKDRFAVTLEVNGISKKIADFYIPGLDQREGHECSSHNLTWLLCPLKTERDALLARVKELESILGKDRLDDWKRIQDAERALEKAEKERDEALKGIEVWNASAAQDEKEIARLRKRLSAFQHNHVTRDIKPKGECPQCDSYHSKQESAQLLASLKSAAKALEFIASGCLVPPDGGDPKFDDAITEARTELASLTQKHPEVFDA